MLAKDLAKKLMETPNMEVFHVWQESGIFDDDIQIHTMILDDMDDIRYMEIYKCDVLLTPDEIVKLKSILVI
jgi:hypothetical protein